MKKILLCLSIMLSTTLVFADDLTLVPNYAELNVGTNLYYAGLINRHSVDGSGGITGFGWSAALGHHFTKIFALEAGFMQGYVQFNRDERVDLPYLSSRFRLALNEHFNFIGKLGLMYPLIDNNESLLLPFTGIGVSYAATQKVELALQYQGAVYGVAGAGLLSLGVIYHF